MDIALIPLQERFIQQQLESGKYQSAAEVITEAFHLLQDRDQQAQVQRMDAINLSQFSGSIRLTEDLVRFQQRMLRFCVVS